MWCRVPLAIAAVLSVSLCGGVARAELRLEDLLGRDLFDALFGGRDAAPAPQTEVPERVQMLVLDLTPLEEAQEEVLSVTERQQACEAGVAQLQTQWAIHHELAQMRKRLRNSGFRHGYERFSVVQWADVASCAELKSTAQMEECQRILRMEKTLRPMIKHGKTPTEICAKVYSQQDPEPLSCKLCKRFVQMVVQAVKKDLETVEQVREILGDICDEMAADSMCHTFLQRYDDIVKWIKDGTDPAYICPMIYMCPAGKREAPGSMVALMDDKKCWFCDEVTTVLEVLVQEQPDKVDIIREYADMICQMLGDQSPCHKYDKQLDYVIDALKQRKTPHEICKALKYCETSSRAIDPPTSIQAAERWPSRNVAMPMSVHSFHSCFYCVHVTSVVRFVVSAYPNLVEPIRTIIQHGCMLTPKDCRCDDYVKNFDKIVSMVKAGKEPLAVCESINMCKKKPSNGRNELLDLIVNDHVAEEVAALVVPSESSIPTIEIKCFHCHYISTLVEIVMQERPQILDEVREFGDMICGLLGDANQCHKYMKQLDYVVDELKKGKKPREICVALKYCTKSTSKAIAPGAKSFSRFDRKENALEASLPQVSMDGCFYCTVLGRFLKIAMDQDPQEVDQIRLIADLVCNMLPEDNKCHAIVHDMDKLIDALHKGQDPTAVCHDLHYCTKRVADDSVMRLLPKPSVGSNKCAFCDGILTVVKYAIQQQPDTMNEIREAAGIVCELLPEDDDCHDQLKQFDMAVKELKEGKSPHVICHDLKYCPASTTAPIAFDRLYKKATEDAETSMSVGCLFCDYTAMILKHIPLDKKQLARAKQALETICTVLPPSARCDVLTSKFDSLAAMMHTGKRPSEACHQIGLCAAKWADEEQAHADKGEDSFPFGHLLEVQ